MPVAVHVVLTDDEDRRVHLAELLEANVRRIQIRDDDRSAAGAELLRDGVRTRRIVVGEHHPQFRELVRARWSDGASQLERFRAAAFLAELVAERLRTE